MNAGFQSVLKLWGADERMSLAALSQIHRFVVLARGLDLRISELLDLCRLAGGPLDGDGRIDPFLGLDSVATFIDRADGVAATGLSVAETRHLITHWQDSPYAQTEALISQRITQMRLDLDPVRTETQVPEEEREAALERQLAAVPGFQDAAIRAEAISIIDDTFTSDLAARNAFIGSHFGAIMDVATAIAAFAPFAGADADRPAAISERRRIALDAIYAVLARAAATVTLAAQFAIDERLADYLLWTLRRVAGALRIGERLVEPAFLERAPDGETFLTPANRAAMPDLFDDWGYVAKAQMVAEALGWQVATFAWLVDNAGSFGLADLAALPLRAGDAPIALDDWRVVARWTAVLAAFPENPQRSLRAILNDIGRPSYARADLTEDLAAWSGREPTTLAAIFDGFDTPYPAGFREVELFERLLEALRVQRLAGVPAARLFQWAIAGTTAELAREVKLAAKARHSGDAWLEIARPLQDQIREAKRVALLTWLTSRPATAGQSWADSRALFEEFLIDPEMTSCRTTSRLVQATGSVQLFVQRCLMNLESDVLADADQDEDWLHWEWMANYRIWEAARKVFLWPENVIRPELNTMKSPLFLELEQQLAQVEVSEETAEDALVGYLEKLDTAANLEVAASHEEHTSSARIVHVLTRTRAEPVRWYYRQNILKKDTAQGYWTPWKLLDIEFQGAPVFGFVNRRLHLFWLGFTEKNDPNMELPPARESDLPPIDEQKMWEIQLAWSIHKEGSWTAPVTGKKKLIHPWFRPRRTFHIKTSSAGPGRLAIDVFVSTSSKFNPLTLRVYRPETNTVGNKNVSVQPHSESFRPWHSSQFIFNGDVVEVRLRDVSDSFTKVNQKYGQDGAEIVELPITKATLRQPVGMFYLDQSIRNQSANTIDVAVFRTGSGPTDTGLLLESAPAPFRLIVPSPGTQFDSSRPFFYSDPNRSYFVEPRTYYRIDGSWTTMVPSGAYVSGYQIRHRFEHLYHPFSRYFLSVLNRSGLKGLFKREVQLNPPSSFDFQAHYDPTQLVRVDHNRDIVDFDFPGAYSTYNWEIFFHAPFLIACKLAENQRFDEALKMLRTIFDPTSAASGPAPARFWITKPFHLMSAEDYNEQRIERLLRVINSGSPAYVAQVAKWRDNPFDPHLIARLRPVAYQRAVVMKCIDVLLDAGDLEFRRFTTESLNIATQYYVRAQALLGRRPETVPVDRRLEAKSFHELEAELDAFGNALAEVKNTLPPSGGSGSGAGSEPLPPITIFYFCIPGNDRLLDYWDRVERNLFNLRHCRDVEGIERQPPLFSAPIDPMLLVRAAAAEVDLSTLAVGGGAPAPHYRFRATLERAYSFAREVETLGSALQSALERRDERELDLLGQTQEKRLRELIKTTLEHRIEEFKAEIDGLVETAKRVAKEYAFYEKEADTFMNAAEGIGIGLKGLSILFKGISLLTKGGSAVAHALPQVKAGANGAGGSPEATGEWGGEQVGKSTDKSSEVLSGLADISSTGADIAFKIGAAIDKQALNSHQRDTYEIEQKEVEKRLIAAEARLAMARAELAAEEARIAQADETIVFMKSRYTRKELYDWMVAQLSTVYFQAYRVAFDMARSAATCAEREVTLNGADYIKFGYWTGSD